MRGGTTVRRSLAAGGGTGKAMGPDKVAHAEDSSASARVKEEGAGAARAVVRVPLVGDVELKYVSLVLLVVQNVLLVMSVRYSRVHTVDGVAYISSTAVVMSEVVKLLVSLAGEYLWYLKAGESLVARVRDEMWSVDMLKLSVPGVLYTVQNNLLFVALSNLSIGVYQVSAQLKILTTAVLSVAMLGKRLSFVQWLALVTLTFGVGVVQVSTAQGGPHQQQQLQDGDQVLGMVAILLACTTSGIAGVYTEKLLKQSRPVSLLMRNFQLALYGVLIGQGTVLVNDWALVKQGGYFQGYGTPVWIVIATQAVGGLLVAVVMRYADNILKGFATSLSIILATMLSVAVFGAEINALFVMGAALVLVAVFLYGSFPAAPAAQEPKYVAVSDRDSAEDDVATSVVEVPAKAARVEQGDR
jgi:UDP-sugar transporter A1/2/3